MSALVRLVVIGSVFVILTAVPAQRVWAMGQESFGPAGEHIGRSSDWPKGVEDVLRHPSRVYWNWVNGNEHAYYDGDIGMVNELLELFSEVDLAVHQVVVLTGRASARSFHGEQTPYAVEFALPSGIYLHHVQEYATTGLYSATPRLIVHVNDAMAQHLDELRTPPNVTLWALAHRVEDALAQIDAHDRTLRGRAIHVIGEAGDDSPAVAEVLERVIADDDNEYIRKAAQLAMKQIEKANDPTSQPLRHKVAAYLDSHPQRFQIPKPHELLAALREIDDRYGKGFTARGTMIQPDYTGLGKLAAWTVTMGDHRLVFQQRAVENESHPPTAGHPENTIYVGPGTMASIRQPRIWSDGELTDTKPQVTYEPVGSTYDLLLGRMLWPLGRGFTRRIDRITQVDAEADGTLAVHAESDEGGSMSRWEMRIDPHADFLVRSAKAFRRDRPDPTYIVDNAGVLVASDRCTAHTARWTEGASARPVSISVTSVSAETDAELIQETEDLLQQQSNRGW